MIPKHGCAEMQDISEVIENVNERVMMARTEVFVRNVEVPGASGGCKLS